MPNGKKKKWGSISASEWYKIVHDHNRKELKKKMRDDRKRKGDWAKYRAAEQRKRRGRNAKSR